MQRLLDAGTIQIRPEVEVTSEEARMFRAALEDSAEEHERIAKARSMMIVFHERRDGYHGSGIEHSAIIGLHTARARELRKVANGLEKQCLE
jgi:hypothetical protein